MTQRDQEAWRRLGSVIDPETGLSVVDLGLIYDVQAAGKGLALRMTLTRENCPLGAFLVEAVREALATLCPDGAVLVTLSFDPPWSPERITAAGRKALRG